MDKQVTKNIFILVAIVLAYVGFRFVTQADQGFVPQNDGYAVTGGIMIFSSGMLVGTALHMREKKQ